MEEDRSNDPDMYSRSLSYTVAMLQARFGFKIAREAWRGKDEDPLHPKKYLFYVHREMITFPDLRLFATDQVATKISLPGIMVMRSPVIKDFIQFHPSSKDIQANDWYILEASHQLYKRRSNGENN